jgi:4-diphosphocytidyl-2-C-methyl-D-erythritol kinase
MHLYKDGEGVVVQAPAKVNLFFEVLGKRPDGYHEIETLVAPVGLYDSLFFHEIDGDGLQLTCCPVSGAWGAEATWVRGVPAGPENLAVRAVSLLQQEFGVQKGARIRLVKRIPTAAGLGGGSSDAAAALWAANLVWGLRRSRDEIAQLGSRIGSDVPLFFAPGAAICRGRGERVEPVEGIGPLHVVLVRPPAGLSTAAVYGACRVGEPPRRVDDVVDALRRGDPRGIRAGMFNRLEESARTLSPWIDHLRTVFADTDCIAHQMSGSGTCYFGLCRHAGHARRIARRLNKDGVGIAMAVPQSRG